MTILVPARALAACVLTSLAAAAAQAAVPSAEVSDPLNEIVVTATRVGEPAMQALAPIIVINRKALEDSLATDVGDVLRFHAGLELGRSGGPGQPLSLFIRGANSAQSIVMIDGVRINAGTIGGAPLQNLAPELFERIEVVIGPRSAIYGTDAIGGVVNLITRKGGRSGVDGALGYGRYGTREIAVNGNYTVGATSVGAALTSQRSDGFPTFAADAQDRGYKHWSGTVTAATRFASAEVGAFFWRSAATTEYADADIDFNTGAFLGFTPLAEHFANSAVAVHASGEVTAAWYTRLTMSRIVDDLMQNQGNPFNLNQAPDYDRTARNTLDLQNDVKITGAQLSQIITFGAILSHEQADSLSFGTGYSKGANTQTYYLQDQVAAGPHRLLLAGGGYHHPSFGNHATWNAEYGYAVTPNTLLIAAAGAAFRAPSATDRFGFGANPDLLPESSRNFELGLKSGLGASQQLTFAAFQNTISDLIEFVFDPSDLVNFGKNRNITRARIRGLQASWELRTDPWSLRAALSVQEPRNLTRDSALLRRAKQSFTLSGSRHFGRAELGVDLLESGFRQDGDFVSGLPVRDAGYLLAAFRAKLALTPAWSVTARLDNAFDRRYQLASGYNTAGRAIAIGTRYSFR